MAEPGPNRAEARPLLQWRRMPSRAILLICFFVGVCALSLMVVPFSATTPNGAVALECGPPLFEVIAQPDPAFPVAENGGCKTPAENRVAFGLAFVLASIVVATITHRRSRQSNVDRDTLWLARQDRVSRYNRSVEARQKSRRRPHPSTLAVPALPADPGDR